MYLASLTIRNFRKFDENENVIYFNNGLNVIVGENDSGKSAIIDAIRIALGTTDNSWNKVKSSDFHNEDFDRRIDIICEFQGLTEFEKAVFLEYLTYGTKDDSQIISLYLHNYFTYSVDSHSVRTVIRDCTGKNGDGASLSPDVKDYLRATYLKPLRDANVDMQSGKKSRLSQIIHGMPNIKTGEDNCDTVKTLDELSLVGIFNLTNKLLGEHKVINSVNSDIGNVLSEKMLLKNDSLVTKIEVSDSTTSDEQKVVRLLEKLDLTIDKSNSQLIGNVGLGTSNIVSMACEMLLHKAAAEDGRSTILLIEEPEAHIHAQRQLKLIQSLDNRLNDGHQQIIMTTHSPLLASVVSLNNIMVIKDAQVYSMAFGNTLLVQDDYRYLEAYLDATKANLFFARSVIIVEGAAEELLFPTIARLLGRSFTDFGCSIVNVRGIGLDRFARLFQRSDASKQLAIKVSCVTDKDIMPNCAPSVLWPKTYKEGISKWLSSKNRRWKAEADFNNDPAKIDEAVAEIREKTEGQYVKTFVANQWTLEYDIAYYGLQYDLMANILKNTLMKLAYEEGSISKKDTFHKKIEDYKTIEEKASYFYSFFKGGNVSKAAFAQELAISLDDAFGDKEPEALSRLLPPYIVEAICYVTGG